MGTNYAQISIEERCRIASLQEQGRSIRQIAADLDRAPSTIAREINRNAGRQVGYRPAYASEQAKARRWKGSKLERDPILRQAVLDRLKQGWSPEQVAGRLARQQAKPSVSHETIYRFLYAQIARTKDYRCGTISPGPRPNAVAGAKKAEAAQWTPSRPESPSHKGPPRPQIGKRQAIGKPTS